MLKVSNKIQTRQNVGNRCIVLTSFQITQIRFTYDVGAPMQDELCLSLKKRGGGGRTQSPIGP